MASNKQIYIGAGAQLAPTCTISPGSHIGSEACLGDTVVVGPEVRILGQVTLCRGVVVGPHVLLVGPLVVGEETILSTSVKVGAVVAQSKTTVIGKQVRIGCAAEILRGVAVGDHTRLRANSRLEGDLPDHALAGGSPAVLENYICANCNAVLRPIRRVNQVSDLACPICDQTRVRIPIPSWPEMSHIALPDRASGAYVSLSGLDPRWIDDREMAWRP